MKTVVFTLGISYCFGGGFPEGGDDCYLLPLSSVEYLLEMPPELGIQALHDDRHHERAAEGRPGDANVAREEVELKDSVTKAER